MRAMPPTTTTSRAALAVTVLLLVVAVATAQLDHYGWVEVVEDGHADGGAVEVVAPYCAGARGEECVAGSGGEVVEAARRRLQGGGYISYDAMRRNSVPCSYRGASYYNCRPGGQANPYSRGCSAITQCRG